MNDTFMDYIWARDWCEKIELCAKKKDLIVVPVYLKSSLKMLI